jgi:hypothetical protein
MLGLNIEWNYQSVTYSNQCANQIFLCLNRLLLYRIPVTGYTLSIVIHWANKDPRRES